MLGVSRSGQAFVRREWLENGHRRRESHKKTPRAGDLGKNRRWHAVRLFGMNRLKEGAMWWISLRHRWAHCSACLTQQYCRSVLRNSCVVIMWYSVWRNAIQSLRTWHQTTIEDHFLWQVLIGCCWVMMYYEKYLRRCFQRVCLEAI
jgi:hypothetical protein